ncbi:MAG: chemotaxis protein CheB [Chloroflexota bacterium]
MKTLRKYDAIVIGGSAGAMTALGELLPAIPAHYPLPVVITLHLHPWQDRYFLQHFNERCQLTVKEADEKEKPQAGYVYFAPPNYHLLFERDRTLSLSIDEKVHYSRPSIDVLFETAAEAFGPQLVGVVLTGANNDGAHGLSLIKQAGGLAIVQDPETAESPYMPKAAIAATTPDYVLPVAKIGTLLAKLAGQGSSTKGKTS